MWGWGEDGDDMCGKGGDEEKLSSPCRSLMSTFRLIGL